VEPGSDAQAAAIIEHIAQREKVRAVKRLKSRTVSASSGPATMAWKWLSRMTQAWMRRPLC